MVCPSCSTDNVDQFKFCPECGCRLAAPSPPGSAGTATPIRPAARLDEAAQAARLLEQAFELYDDSKYDEALGCCQAALALDPSGSTAHSLLGMIYERMGKTAEAVQQYQLVLRMNPDSIADAIKLETLVSGQDGPGRRLAGLSVRRRVPAGVGAMVAAVTLVVGVWATSRAVNRMPGSTGRRAAHASNGPVPGPSLPPSSAAPVGMPGAGTEGMAPARGTAPASAAAGNAPGASTAPAGTGPVASLPAPPPANAWPGLRGAYPPVSRTAHGSPAPAPGRSGLRADRPDARSGYLAPAPILNVEKIDPGHAAPLGDVPGASLPASPGAAPRSSRGRVPVLPPATDVGEAPAPAAPAATAALPPASTAPPAAPPSASISIQPLDDTPSTAATRSAPPASPPARPVNLSEALQHEQMAAYYRRQGDDQAAYSEYQYARDLFRKVQQRGGREAAVAAQGAVAAQTGMSRLQGP
jgi:hypothetical protein